jgi:exodeoxyribonuclease VII small subunit
MTHDSPPVPGDLEADLARWRAALADDGFEEIFRALEEVVARLERGQLRLEETLACYELGIHLAERCGRILDQAELRVSRLDGSLAPAEGWESDDPFDKDPSEDDETG